MPAPQGQVCKNGRFEALVLPKESHRFYRDSVFPPFTPTSWLLEFLLIMMACLSWVQRNKTTIFGVSFVFSLSFREKEIRLSLRARL